MPVHVLDNALQFAQPVVVLIAIAAWVLALITWFRDRRISRELGKRQISMRYVLSLATFTGIIALEFFLVGIVQSAALAEVRPLLEPPITKVAVAGQTISSPDALLSALRAMSNPLGHHSHPDKTFAVSIQGSKGMLELSVARDSDMPDEYWVFYPGFHTTQLNAIGHIYTKALDGF